MKCEVIYEDNHLIVVNKPFCMPSQQDESQDESVFDWVKNYIKVTYQKPGNVYVGLTHRLDRPTGGILVLCKTSKAAARLSKQFSDRKPLKTYWAITENVPKNPSGDLSQFVKKLNNKNIMRLYNKTVEGGKSAKLSYQVLQMKDRKALLEVQPKTGRKHQIRVQLAGLGCPIVGDVKYGASAPNFDKSIALLAKSISIEHPTLKEWMTFSINLPKHPVWDAFSSYD